MRATFAACLMGCSLAMGAQTSIPASQFVFKSTGAQVGADYNLWGYGYIGTFVVSQRTSTVTLKVQAAGQPAFGMWPRMGIHIGKNRSEFNVVGAAFKTYTARMTVPAGTTLVRIEFLNDAYDSTTSQDRNLLLRSLTVSGSPDAAVRLVNPTNSSDLKQTVFAAADTTIENDRKQDAFITVLNPSGRPFGKGQSVHVHLARHAFNFGTAVPGVGGYWDAMWPNPYEQGVWFIFQAKILENFNLIEEENAGKWAYTEPTRWHPTMRYVDAILDFAQRHDMRVRHHNVLWGAQQPDWAVNLENSALGSDPVAASQAKTTLWDEILYRIGYVVRQRSRKFQEVDGINEASAGHQPVFLNIYGYAGIAAIYNACIEAARASGSSAHVYFNEFSVFNSNSDMYGGWYLDFIHSVLNNGVPTSNQPMLGVGVQYYNIGGIDHDPVRIYQTLANLGTLQLPISLTEFGIGGGFTSQAPQVLQDALWMMFGFPEATTFNCWGFWSQMMWVNDAAMYDANWNITPTGMIWQQMTGVKNWNLAGVPYWTTDLVLATDDLGRVNFRGFLGDYRLTSASSSGTVSLAAGVDRYRVLLK